MDELSLGRIGSYPLGNWVAGLRAFAGAQQMAEEYCELCNTEIGHEHPHLIEPHSRRILCACTPCALLFASREARHYRRIPRDVARLPDFACADGQWEALTIPINLAFFFHSSPEARVLAMYPGPAGATESRLDLAAWDTLATANPILATLEEDVEALLVNRTEGAREYYRVPIDRCYELVGLIRRNWHGLSGGEEVQLAIRQFFDQLRGEAE